MANGASGDGLVMTDGAFLVANDEEKEKETSALQARRPCHVR